MENIKRPYKCIVRYQTKELQLYEYQFDIDNKNNSINAVDALNSAVNSYVYAHKSAVNQKESSYSICPKKSKALQLLEEIEYMQFCDELNDTLTLSELNDKLTLSENMEF